MEITVEEYNKLKETYDRVKAFKDFIEAQAGYSSTLSKVDCIAILGLNSKEEVKNETTKEAYTQA